MKISWSSFVGLFATMFTGNKGDIRELSPVEPGIENPFRYPRHRKKSTPGAGERKVLVANCKKIWRNRHGK